MSRKRQRTLAEFNVARGTPRRRVGGSGKGSDDVIVIEDEEEENTSVVKQEEVRCPLCNADITHFEIYLKEAHTERCLDKVPPPKSPQGKSPQRKSAQGKSPQDKSPQDKIPQRKNAPAPSRNPRPRAVLPSIKVVQFHSSKVVVDGFNFAKDDAITHYFLSHFHSDHYMGLRKSWDHGVVYGSEITINLAQNRFNMDPSRLRPLRMRELSWVSETLSVVLLDANHCPGATVFLFQEWDSGRARVVKQVLHTGDFRANDRLIAELHDLTPQIDDVYLDTTYLLPGFHFPSQESVLQVTAHFAHELVARGPRELFHDTQRSILSYSGTAKPERPYKFLFLVGTYTIGKEKLAIAIAQALHTKIFVPSGSPRHKLVSLYSDYFPQGLITHTLAESCVHLVRLSTLHSREAIQSYLGQYSHMYDDAVGFIPTGWTFANKWARQQQFPDLQSRIRYCEDVLATASDSLDLQFILSQFKRENRFQVFKVPYSEHSSFKDLIKFGCHVPSGRVLATVNLGSQEKLRDMQQWFAAWNEMAHKVITKQEE